MTRSPYDDPQLYDRLFGSLTFDLPFYRELVRRHGGPILDVGCGTGRLLLPLSGDGMQVDGWEPSAAMFETLQRKARAAGVEPRLFTGGIDGIPTDARYGVVFCAFNAFAHNLTTEEQIDILRKMRAATRAGGVVAIGAGHPPLSEWGAPPMDPVLEFETEPAADGVRLRLFDLRTFDNLRQIQHSRVSIEEVDAEGRTLARHDSDTDMRWLFQPEFELLLRQVGFAGWRIHGGYAFEPRTSDAQPLVVEAW